MLLLTYLKCSLSSYNDDLLIWNVDSKAHHFRLKLVLVVAQRTLEVVNTGHSGLVLHPKQVHTQRCNYPQPTQCRSFWRQTPPPKWPILCRVWL